MSWKFGLKKAIQDPNNILVQDSEVVVIKDLHPKAQHHFLVMPKAEIDKLEELTKDHVGLLKNMVQKGCEVSREATESGGHVFKFGFHGIPSMLQLHMHVISDDFISPSLKHKKHWNSFNTDFFIPASKVITDLETTGRVKLPEEDVLEVLLKTDLYCHKCNFSFKNFPNLKKHLTTHL